MSIEFHQRQVNTLDKEIATLERKLASKESECAKLLRRINVAKKGITKHTAPSIASQKNKRILRWQNDFAKRSNESAELREKLADKKIKRNDAYPKLTREEKTENQKIAQKNEQRQKEYEAKIAELHEQINANSPSPTQIAPHNDAHVEYDVFVSHASEDKKDFVNDLVATLEEYGYKVWYDTHQLRWGSSIRAEIEKGLKNSRFAIVVLSPSYFADEKYWPTAELSAFFQLETVYGRKILPIWHKLTKDQVLKYSPLMADKKAINTATYTVDEIALSLKSIFENIAEEEQKID